MACNNTTYYEMLMNNSDLVNELYKTSYFVGILNYNTPAAMQLNKILTPIWVFIGIFGNSISAMVWANPRMRTCNTAAYYLTCLSIADLTFLILCFIYELENPWLLGTLDLLCWCQVFNMANMAVQYFCVFLVFAFTFERFLSMCFPFKSERFGKTRTPRIIFCLLTIAILMSTPQAYFWDIHPIVGECRLRLGISVSEDSPVSFFIVYTWCSEIAVFGLLPLLVLLFNIAVVLKIRSVGKLTFGNSSINSRVSSRRGTCHSTSLIGSQQNLDNTKLASSRSNGGADTKTNNYKGTTVTLLWVSFFLILTMLPNTLMYAMQEFVTYGPIPCRVEDMSRDPDWRRYFSFISTKLVIKELSLSHHVGNVFIYLATSKRFRTLTMKSLVFKSTKRRCERRDTSLQTIRSVNTRSLGDGV